MKTYVSACCLKCGYFVTGTSHESVEQAVSRLSRNVRNHRRGKRCRDLQRIWGSPRAAWGR